MHIAACISRARCMSTSRSYCHPHPFSRPDSLSFKHWIFLRRACRPGNKLWCIPVVPQDARVRRASSTNSCSLRSSPVFWSRAASVFRTSARLSHRSSGKRPRARRRTGLIVSTRVSSGSRRNPRYTGGRDNLRTWTLGVPAGTAHGRLDASLARREGECSEFAGGYCRRD